MSNDLVPSDGEVHELVPADTIGVLARAEIDMAIATAKQYPRSVRQFKQLALEMATLDEETAASCFYALPRGIKSIEGPSVRLAEIVGSAWGNIRYGARVVGDDGRIITAQGVCHDLERNVSATVEVQRRVTDRSGRRFTEDMVVVTGNAACSLALRNAVFKVVPMAYVKNILDQARKVAIGDAKTLATKRAEAVGYFAKMGVNESRLLAAVGKRGLEDVGLEELAYLKGLATSIKEGQTTVDEAFPAEPAKRPGPAHQANSEKKEPGRKASPEKQRHVANLFASSGWSDEQVAEAMETRGIPSLELMTEQQAAALIDWMNEALKAPARGREPGEDNEE